MRRSDLAGQPAVVEVRARVEADGKVALRAPAVGIWCNPPSSGAFLLPGADVGELVCLGRRIRLCLPRSVAGIVVDHGVQAWPFARVAVDFDKVLMHVDPNAAAASSTASASIGSTEESTAGLVFRAPSSGRFYVRPRPDADAYVEAGDRLSVGDTVGLLEVMKTFTRLVYQGDGLPASAIVKRVVPADDTELEPGDVILELDPATGAA